MIQNVLNANKAYIKIIFQINVRVVLTIVHPVQILVLVIFVIRDIYYKAIPVVSVIIHVVHVLVY